ncbi:aminopeptidase P family protein [Owenweeksia hongkongensis]|uniref:aminopeptidase P family protein n=1 Tax=Owenweeksia hongkongensis TaxID=253245 RepID=UPI003A926A4D
MRYKQLPKEVYIENRAKFTKHLKPKSLAVFNSNDIYPTGSDSTLPFRQHGDILALSGVDQEESILVIFPDAYKEEHREMLFLKETNDHIAVWEGAKLNKEQAFELSGIKNVFWLQDFERIFNEVMSHAENVYLNTNEHLRANLDTETREARFVKWCQNKYPAHEYSRCAPIMHKVRAIKTPGEIAAMQTAADISVKGYKRVMKFMAPGKWEYELEAEFMHEFLRNRSRGFAYTPIIGGGYNACVLHYIENNDQLRDGELVLFDVGAEYANYSSDVTRCYPVNGRYTDRQKEVYSAVLRVKKASEKLLVPGNNLNDYHKAVGEIMTKELVDLKLISMEDVKNQDPSWPAYKKYFMHGTSHYIGLDTHDAGLWTADMEPNMVFTCEPGIYIPEEKLGIRLEDDLVVTENGLINLTKEIPIEIEEIEDFMNS